MSTPLPWSHRRPRTPASGAPAARRGFDGAKVGRSAVRRRATGMTAAEAEAALEDAELTQHINRDREDLAGDTRGPAEIAEWQRIVRLLTESGGPYDPAADAVVQDELAADRQAARAEQQRLEEQRRLDARADHLAELAGYGRLDRTVESRPGDEDARDVLAGRLDYRAPVVGGWLARALADRSGHYAGPAARTAAAGSLPAEVRAHAALLTALGAEGEGESELEFAGRLAQADPAATHALAAWITARTPGIR
ncbi:hypothetical protein GCM10010232_70090 [Streptomyces amakusaensis]|uniref:Uncharacterized protein n=1 Tax=Streptomyces amakusaensis TaxID=67271 RepID=A0ABW0ATW8_9ACTN